MVNYETITKKYRDAKGKANSEYLRGGSKTQFMSSLSTIENVYKRELGVLSKQEDRIRASKLSGVNKTSKKSSTKKRVNGTSSDMLARFDDQARLNTDKLKQGKISYSQHQKTEDSLRKKYLGSTGVTKNTKKTSKRSSTKKRAKKLSVSGTVRKSVSSGVKKTASYWRKRYFASVKR